MNGAEMNAAHNVAKREVVGREHCDCQACIHARSEVRKAAAQWLEDLLTAFGPEGVEKFREVVRKRKGSG